MNSVGDNVKSNTKSMGKNNLNKGLSGIGAVIILIISSAILVLADQLTKVASVNNLKGKDPFVLINNILEFYYLENTGTAWGLFGGARTFFLILTVIILIAVLFLVYRMPYTKKYMPLHIILIFITSGAVGNFIDRLLYGYVRDFIYFKAINFPIFNVADIYVTVSMFLLVFFVLFKYDEEDFDFIRIKKHDK